MTIIEYLNLGGSLKLNYKGGSGDIEKDLRSWYGNIELTMLNGVAFFQGIRSRNYHKNITNPEQALYIFMKEYKSPKNLAYVLSRIETKKLDERDYENPDSKLINQVKEEMKKITQENILEFNRPEWTTDPSDPTDDEVIKAFDIEIKSLDDTIKYLDVMQSLLDKYPHVDFPTHIGDFEGHGYSTSLDWRLHDSYGGSKENSSKHLESMIEHLKKNNRTSFRLTSGWRTNTKDWDIIVDKIIKI